MCVPFAFFLLWLHNPLLAVEVILTYVEANVHTHLHDNHVSVKGTGKQLFDCFQAGRVLVGHDSVLI